MVTKKVTKPPEADTIAEGIANSTMKQVEIARKIADILGEAWPAARERREASLSRWKDGTIIPQKYVEPLRLALGYDHEDWSRMLANSLLGRYQKKTSA